MSADITPHKRKVRKRKRDDDDTKESHHGVFAGKMGVDDVHLHVQGEPNTGGHWCAKLLFFSLLAILLGLIGLIILENRGLHDVDMPLSESRFSDYLDGWVDEYREIHEEHSETETQDLVNEDHDENEEDEGFEEDEEEDREIDENFNEINLQSTETLDQKTSVYSNEEASNEKEEEVKKAHEDEYNNLKYTDSKQQTYNSNNQIDENELYEEHVTNKINDDLQFTTKAWNKTSENNAIKWTSNLSIGNKKDIILSTLIDEDMDDDEDSAENFIENDPGEEQYLESIVEKTTLAHQDEETAQSSSIAVKIIVGLALIYVARHILLNKNLDEKSEADKPFETSSIVENEEILGKRRLTLFEQEIDSGGDEDLNQEPIISTTNFNLKSDALEKLQTLYNLSQSDESNEAEYNDFNDKYFENINNKSENFYDVQEVIKVVNISNQSEVPEREDKGQIIDLFNKSLDTNGSTIYFDEDADQNALNEVNNNYEYEGEDEDDIDEEDEVDDDGSDDIGEEDNDVEIIEDYDGPSDVDDEDLMKRLEAKYGKLPNQEKNDIHDQSWTKISSTERGSQSINDQFDEELRNAENYMHQNSLDISLQIYDSLLIKNPQLLGALYGRAQVLDKLSEKLQSNQILKKAIEAYEHFLKLDKKIDDKTFKDVAERCIDRMRFAGAHLSAIRIHDMLITRFKDDPYYRNQMTVTYLLINRLSDAKNVLLQTLSKWKNDGFALVHYGFVLKNLDRNLEEAVIYLSKGIKSNAEGTQDGRFYFNLGDALQRLGRQAEAIEIYREGAKKKLFLSEYQRSLYNINGLKSQPFWTKYETTYEYYFDTLENNWMKIKDEGMKLLNSQGYFQDEAEGLKDHGDWKQFELFARGYKNIKNCKKAPLTCAIIELFPAAKFCKRGQVKFSVTHPDTHIWPHCGPTNCRLRAHLGLKIPNGTAIRVEKIIKNWKEGQFLIFDDSYEHEVWNNGTELRLVLIVDVWHPELNEKQKNDLSPI